MQTLMRDYYLLRLGFLLLGAASICFLALTPLPMLIHFPPFPGGMGWALGCGCVGGGGGLCLLLGWWQTQRATRHTNDAANNTQERLTRGVATSEAVVDLITEEELAQVPRWFMCAFRAHQSAGRNKVARWLLAEWCTLPPARHPSRQMTTYDLCHICGKPEQAPLLLRCASCQRFAHGQCSTLVRQIQADEISYANEQALRPFCQFCLEAYQAQGWTLMQDDDGWLFIQP